MTELANGVGKAPTPLGECNLNYSVLTDLCLNNAKYFEKDSSENGQRLYLSFLAIKDTIELIAPKVSRIREQISRFDFNENTPGNGYRSFLMTVDAAINHGIQLNKKVCLKRESTFCRKSYLAKEIENCAQLITSLDTCLKHLETLLSWSGDGNLFPDEEHSPQELLSECEDINQYCFYGRSLGFQYCDSLKNILQWLSMSMAIFSEFYYNRGSFFSKYTSSVLSASKYLHDPEKRARRIVNISQNADIDFCKAFWFLSESELMCSMPNAVSPRVAVSKLISLPPEPFTVTTANGREIEVPVPKSHIGVKPIQVRLISYEVHEGMMGEAAVKKNKAPPSKGLLIHCHGGGFVAQSSLSHECYLRDWAKQLDVPILSIDYSLAPEAPFPRALEEVTYAYCWALKNHQLLGSSGERIVAAGDSAGANLILAATLKCIHLGLKLPDGIFVAYVPTLVNFIPSPSRLMCMMDPLLPFGFMMRCLKAYACPENQNAANSAEQSDDTESFEEISESDLQELQAHKSPAVSETSDTLTYGSFVSNDDTGTTTTNVLDKYVLDSETDTDGTKVPVLKQENSSAASSHVLFDYSLQTKFTNFLTNLRTSLGNWMSEKTDFRQRTNAEKFLDMDRGRPSTNLVDEFRFVVPKDPYLSPYWASDEDLKKMPPTRVLSVHMDPCLDDCVMFSKKLKSLGNDVQLKLLDGLPHGFLNFSLLSKEAYEGSKICVNYINELLNLDGLEKS